MRRAIGSNIRAERARAQITQVQLAAAMKQRGYRWHHQTIGVVESGKQRVTADELLTLAEVLGCPADSLWRVSLDEPAGAAGVLDLTPGWRGNVRAWR